MSEVVTQCVICGSDSTTRTEEPLPVDLCDEHWTAYRTDWILMGWCVDHYAEALRVCPRHNRIVEPL